MNPQYVSALKGFSLGLLCLAMSACESPPTQVDQRFGLAVRQAQAQQTQHLSPAHCMPIGHGATCGIHGPQPQAGSMHERHPPSANTDGLTAQSAIERYQESFQTPPTPTPVFNIGVGTSRAR